MNQKLKEHILSLKDHALSGGVGAVLAGTLIFTAAAFVAAAAMTPASISFFTIGMGVLTGGVFGIEAIQNRIRKQKTLAEFAGIALAAGVSLAVLNMIPTPAPKTTPKLPEKSVLVQTFENAGKKVQEPAAPALAKNPVPRL